MARRRGVHSTAKRTKAPRVTKATKPTAAAVAHTKQRAALPKLLAQIRTLKRTGQSGAKLAMLQQRYRAYQASTSGAKNARGALQRAGRNRRAFVASRGRTLTPAQRAAALRNLQNARRKRRPTVAKRVVRRR
jgi:hypothetical protein